MESFDSQLAAARQNSLKGRWQDERRLLSAIVDNHHHHHHRSASSSSFYSRVVVGVGGTTSTPPSPTMTFMATNPNSFPVIAGTGFDDHHDFVSTVIPPVTVVLEGRAICQRISLHKHAGYKSLAKALRQMFVLPDGATTTTTTCDHHHTTTTSTESTDLDLDLSNAVPGHLIAYEDMESDLLLVGDLNWKDFVRVAKRIRILPVKAHSRRGRGASEFN